LFATFELLNFRFFFCHRTKWVYVVRAKTPTKTKSRSAAANLNLNLAIACYNLAIACPHESTDPNSQWTCVDQHWMAESSNVRARMRPHILYLDRDSGPYKTEYKTQTEAAALQLLVSRAHRDTNEPRGPPRMGTACVIMRCAFLQHLNLANLVGQPHVLCATAAVPGVHGPCGLRPLARARRKSRSRVDGAHRVPLNGLQER
jgi:hypothetical protein